MLTINEARDFLRLDGTDNDVIISSLLDAIPGYIEVSTGMSVAQQNIEPLAKTVAKFILQLWYNAEQSDSDKLQRTIDGLFKALSVMARTPTI
ncbi:head-tail connector protein [Anaerotignum sp.]|uniref:head-tail connector protein n=1 Tax=Anaerotignum sp. TaxID=2039241 RepID=UPI003332855C